MIYVINIFLILLAIYFAIGMLVGIGFVAKGEKIDILLAYSKKRVRALLFCGVVFTWPFMVGRLFKVVNANS